MENADHSPTTWSFDSSEQLWLYRELERTDEEVIIVYRSYLDSEAYPSGMDIRFADSSALHAIVSLRDPANPDFRLYRILDGEVAELIPWLV